MRHNTSHNSHSQQFTNSMYDPPHYTPLNIHHSIYTTRYNTHDINTKQHENGKNDISDKVKSS